jgi:hypothetical protein
LSATIGVGLSAKSGSYSTRICGQSVRDSDGASLWTALIAAWIWYQVPVPTAAVLVGQQDEVAVWGSAGVPT